ncbi:MAG: heavy-metal-associated domain-containing protein [Proteobacteria bacterium]|nr:heavy-metal-associated domain-containing protein [Pseudomonadota bacterium]
MRRIITTFSILALLSGSAHAETIIATVNGMVCGFCATGIEKTFKRQPAVETVKVDLDSKLVTVGTKPTQTLDDGTVSKLLSDSGYSVVSIARKP